MNFFSHKSTFKYVYGVVTYIRRSNIRIKLIKAFNSDPFWIYLQVFGY